MFDITFRRPSLGRLFGLLLACTTVTLIIYGVRVSIEDGTVTNKPQLLQQLMFWPFAVALAMRVAAVFGLSENRWPGKLLMVGIFFIPVALGLAWVAGFL